MDETTQLGTTREGSAANRWVSLLQDSRITPDTRATSNSADASRTVDTDTFGEGLIAVIDDNEADMGRHSSAEDIAADAAQSVTPNAAEAPTADTVAPAPTEVSETPLPGPPPLTAVEPLWSAPVTPPPAAPARLSGGGDPFRDMAARTGSGPLQNPDALPGSAPDASGGRPQPPRNFGTQPPQPIDYQGFQQPQPNNQLAPNIFGPDHRPNGQYAQPPAPPQRNGSHQDRPPAAAEPQLAPRRPKPDERNAFEETSVISGPMMAEARRMAALPAQPGPARAIPGPAAPAPRPQPADSGHWNAAPIQAAAAGIQETLFSTAAAEHTAKAEEGFRGFVNDVLHTSLAPSAKEKRHIELRQRIRASKDKMYSIAVLTIKGGAGKTTITSTLGQTFASIRSDGVLAVDADPASPDLNFRTAVHSSGLSLVELLQEPDLGQREFVRRFVSTTDSDLDVLASGWRADVDRVLEAADIDDVSEIASHYYSLLLWDSGVDIFSDLVRQILVKSDALVLMVQASTPGSIAAGRAIDWLRAHGFEGLLARTVLVVNEPSPNTRVDLKALDTLLRRQQLKVHHIPFDTHLEEGSRVDLNKLNSKTRRAFEELAGVLADDFVIPQPPVAVATAS